MPESNGICELRRRFAWKPDDQVGGERDFPLGPLDPRDSLQIHLARVLAVHRLQHAGRTALYGQMHVITKRRDGLDALHAVLVEVPSMRGSKTHTSTTGDFPARGQQLCK